MTAPVLDSADLPEEERPADWPLPPEEPARVAALHGFGVLDQPRQADLDAAARLAAFVCGTPTAVINLIDSDRQWQAGAYGVEPGEVSRGDSMCQHTVLGTEVVYTPDARHEALFADNPFVTGRHGRVRLYASAPLLTSDGHAIGTVCAFDEAAGSLDATQLGLLRDVADPGHGPVRAAPAGCGPGPGRHQGPPDRRCANRRGLATAISGAIGRAERGLGTPSVVVIDLDGFKAVNDQLGHATGDAVLRSVAQRLTGTARTVDTVARLGGDEFVVLLEHTGGPGASAALARLRRGLEGGWAEVTGGLEVGAALGITTYRAGDSVATLLARADAEMYADKARHGALWALAAVTVRAAARRSRRKQPIERGPDQAGPAAAAWVVADLLAGDAGRHGSPQVDVPLVGDAVVRRGWSPVRPGRRGPAGRTRRSVGSRAGCRGTARWNRAGCGAEVDEDLVGERQRGARVGWAGGAADDGGEGEAAVGEHRVVEARSCRRSRRTGTEPASRRRRQHFLECPAGQAVLEWRSCQAAATISRLVASCRAPRRLAGGDDGVALGAVVTTKS